MRSLKVDYSKQFSGLEEKPESYQELANNFGWAKREVDQDLEGYIHDEYACLRSLRCHCAVRRRSSGS